MSPLVGIIGPMQALEAIKMLRDFGHANIVILISIMCLWGRSIADGVACPEPPSVICIIGLSHFTVGK